MFSSDAITFVQCHSPVEGTFVIFICYSMDINNGVI